MQYDAYRNDIAGLLVDNPFRATDSSVPGAQLGPNDETTAGARQAEVGVAPDNDAFTANAGASVRLPLRTRVTADASFARWRQSDAPLPAFTTNTAVLAAADTAVVPIGALDGAIDIDSQTVQVTSAPWSRLSLRARVRRYAMDNRTPRVALPGVARLDAVWEAVPRLTVPYSHRRTRVEGSIGYGLGSWRAEAGHWQEDFARTFRETEETNETAWTGALSGPLPADGHLRLYYEHSHRGFEAYDSRLSPGASRVNVHPVRSLGAGRRYDQAARDLDRGGARVELAPLPSLVLSASYALELRSYPLTAYGLVRTRAHVGSADASVAPGGRWSAHAFYALELESSFQRVRHSPQPTISIDLRDIWDATLSDTVHSLGGGFAAELDPGRTTLRLEGSFQRSDGLADFDSAPGGTPDLAEDIPSFDDVRWLTVSAEVEHRVRAGWSVAAGASWDRPDGFGLDRRGAPRLRAGRVRARSAKPRLRRDRRVRAGHAPMVSEPPIVDSARTVSQHRLAMRSTRWMLVLLLLAVLPLAGCGDNGNSACEECANDEDCESGLTCQVFRATNGNVLFLCGDANPVMTCPSP